MKLIDPSNGSVDSTIKTLIDINGMSFDLWTNHSIDGLKLPVQGYATYRTKVRIPPNLRNFGIFFSHQFSSSRLIINGELVSEVGFVSEDLNKVVAKRNNTIAYFTSNESELDIILQIGNRDFYQGGARSEFLFGSKQGIEFYVFRNIIFEILVFGLILGASIYHFLFYLLNRNYLPFLLFALMCGFFLIRIPFQNIKVIEFFLDEISWQNQAKILHLSNVFAIILGMYFLRSLVPHANNTKISKIIYLLNILGFIIGILSMISNGYIAYRVNFYYVLIFLPIYLFHSGYIVYLNFKEKTTFYLLGIGFITLGIFANLAIILSYYGYQSGSLLLVGLLSLILTHSLALSRFFATALETKAKLMAEFSKKNQKDLTKQREELQVMMHDSLGSELTDIHVFLERLISNKSSSVPRLSIENLYDRVQKIIKSFRNQLLFMEDLNTAYEDLFTGLNLTVLRRYSDAERELDFEISKNSFHNFGKRTMQFHSTSPQSDIFYLITELCTNDLKYGVGESIWRLDINDNSLKIYQTNRIKNPLQDNEMILKSALLRVLNLKGVLKSRLVNNTFIVDISIPISKAHESLKYLT